MTVLHRYFVHVVVPGLVFLSVYEDAGHGWLGLAGLAVLVTTATIRHALFAAVRFDFPLWCGVPRTVSGFAALALPLSTVVADHGTTGLVAGLAIVAVLSVSNLVPIPYLNHRGARAMQWWVKVLVALFFSTTLVAFAFAREHTFDVFGFWLVGYAATGWVPVHRNERRGFYSAWRSWAAELSA